MDWMALMKNILGPALSGMAAGKRKPNGPPSPLSTPSQTAIGDIHSGIQSALGKGAPPIDTQPVVPQPISSQPVDPSLAPVTDEYGNSTPLPANVPVQPNAPLSGDALGGPPPMQVGGKAQDQGYDPMADERDIARQEIAAMQLKPSPWKDVGAALIQGADNFFNHKEAPVRGWGEIKRDRKLGNLIPQMKVAQDIRKAQQDADEHATNVAYTNERTRTIGEDDKRLAKSADEKARHNVEMEGYWGRKADQGDLKLANDQELLELRDKWATAKDENSKKRLELVEKEMDNRMKRAAEANQTRRDIAGQRESGLGERQRLAMLASQAMTQLKDAMAKGNAAEAAAIKLRLADLKRQSDLVARPEKVPATP